MYCNCIVIALIIQLGTFVGFNDIIIKAIIYTSFMYSLCKHT